MPSSSLEYSSFVGANLTGVSGLDGLTLSYADFANANCTGVNFTNADLTGSNFSNASLSDAILDNALCDGANFEAATMPDNADTKAEFKALVGSWDPDTTIWTDGNPIGA